MKPEFAKTIALQSERSIPEWISHYLIEEIIGEGSSGFVYLALDVRLDRMVALKSLKEPKYGVGSFFDLGGDEARIMASLDHPNIVPIFDVGQTEEGQRFIVSKFIDGKTLAKRLSEDKSTHISAKLRWLASIALALHYSHLNGVVHRDVKPENILIDRFQRPYLFDFGLGQTQQQTTPGEKWRIGTPPYMSPEQASGTAHRISGLSDVFALGVVLYEILTGQLPFSNDREEMLREIIHGEIKPPSSLVRTVPKALENLCLAALSRVPAARPNAEVFAQTLNAQVLEMGSASSSKIRYQNAVPKGLHSFDEDDSNFFLDLLPGPKSGYGLPASVSLWKSRIESTALEKSFRVGLLFGPSGGGKSSFLRSGLIPQLDSNVISVFVEASENTESNIVEALRHRFPRLESENDLASILNRIIAGEGVPIGGRLLLVVDQFEQHLHRVDQKNDDLPKALEIVDGQRIRVLLSVRDEFCVSATQFLSGLSIDLDTGRNACALDLFDRKHARDVLIRFGRGIGVLPEFPIELNRTQRKFVKTVIREISEDGRVSPVQLALIVERFRDLSWDIPEWDKVGGVAGIGVSYVKGCFGNRFSDEQRPVAIKAAQRIFGALIPEDASIIKGNSRTRTELCELVSSMEEAVDFDQLIFTLVRKFRLLSPSQAVGETKERRYNLSHDYLVPVIRSWIDEEKQRTKQGRAQLLLRDRAQIWELDGSRRSLPSFFEWLRIFLFARSSEWTDREMSMMRRASIREAVRISFCAICGCAFLIWGINTSQNRLASRLYSDFKARGMESFDSLEPKFMGLRKKIVPIIFEGIEKSDGLSANVLSQRVLYRMGQFDAAAHVDSILALNPRELSTGIQAMGPFDEGCIEILKTIANDEIAPERAFRAKAALALTDEGLVDVDALVEEWTLRNIDEVVRWADAILSIGESAHTAADKRFRLPDDYSLRRSYDFVISARESAKVAVAFASIGKNGKVMQSLSSKNRVLQRTYVIDLLKPENVGHYALWTTPIEKRKNNHLIAGLLQAIGEVNWDEIPQDKKSALVENVHTAFASNDAEVHFSAKFAMGRWKLKQPEFATQVQKRPGSWFLSPSGISFAVIPEMDGRKIAVAANEVSVEQFLGTMSPTWGVEEMKASEEIEDFPYVFSSEDEIFRFCNALSEREGLEKCYEMKGGMWKFLPDIRDRTGYRIPTLSEWRFACGMGSRLKFYFGGRTNSLQWHAWISDNTDNEPKRVGLSRLNAFGLSDMLGNLAELVYLEPSKRDGSKLPEFQQIGGDYLSSEADFANGIPVREIEREGGWQLGGIRLVRTLALDGN